MKKEEKSDYSIGKFYRLKKGVNWIYWKGDLTDTLSENEKREGVLIKCSPSKAYLQRKDLSIIEVKKCDIENRKDI